MKEFYFKNWANPLKNPDIPKGNGTQKELLTKKIHQKYDKVQKCCDVLC